MTEKIKRSLEWLDWLLKLRPVLIGLLVLIWLGAKPYLWPYFIDYPQAVKSVQVQMKEIKAKLDDIALRLEQLSPQVYEYTGGAIIEPLPGAPIPTFKAGEMGLFHYVIRKNVDCDVVVHEDFVDVDKGIISFTKETVPAHVPESKDFQDIAIQVQLPARPGRYRYSPRIIPKDCPGYSQKRPPASNIFAIVN